MFVKSVPATQTPAGAMPPRSPQLHNQSIAESNPSFRPRVVSLCIAMHLLAGVVESPERAQALRFVFP